jgi:uncharacterized protein with ParB-like and HNH nuclease domain
MNKCSERHRVRRSLDAFMRAYLTMKMNAIPKLDAVYVVFKQYHSWKRYRIGSFRGIKVLSLLWKELEFGNEDDAEIKEILANIRTLKVEVAYPFLLQVYEDYANGVIERGEFVTILKLVESYVFRRVQLRGFQPTHSTRHLHSSIRKSIKAHYLESVQANFILKASYHRFPTDEEFRTELANKDVYNFRNNKYLFEKLEYFNNKERVNTDDLTVEHILPQTLTSQWKEALGADFQRISDTYLHTIGNPYAYWL